MKKNFILLCAMALATGSHAQSFRLGVKGGATISQYAGDGTDNFGQLAGFHGGLFGNLPLARDGFFSLQPELVYSQKGANVEQSGRFFNSRLHYLDLPILARINAGGFIAEAGPQVGYLLSHDNRFTGQATSVKYEKIDVGYVAGVGYQLESGPSIGVRYNAGLRDLFGEVVGGTINPRNSAFQFYLGYLFGSK